MDEQQALLGRSTRPSFFTVPSNDHSNHVSRSSTAARTAEYPTGSYNDNGGSSSDGSDSWWEDSHSSCSSCSRTSESSEDDWDEAVSEKGELLYIEPAEEETVPHVGENEATIGEPTVKGVLPAINKPFSVKEGKFVRWIRRRESKRQRPRLSLVSDQLHNNHHRSNLSFVAIDVPHREGPVDLATMGLQVSADDSDSLIVRSILPDAPLTNKEGFSVGDCLRTINGEEVNAKTLESRLSTLTTAERVVLGFQKRKDVPNGRERPTSRLVQRLTEGDANLQSKISKLPLVVMAIDISDQQEEGSSDPVFCYPDNSPLVAARGSFITLSHLLPSLLDSECKSCTCEVKEETVHVVFYKEDNILLLLGLPDKVCRVEETCHIILNIARALQFNFQTLHCAFQKEHSTLVRIFSSFFASIVSIGTASPLAFGAMDSLQHHFHDFLAEVPWVPLPREAQLQLDDALNELESCDFGHAGDDQVESERLYIVLGSCLYHQGYLLASHLTKEDLLDVHSLLRQEGILELSRAEGVTRMVLWREVFPHSVNRGLPPSGPTTYAPPVGRWMLLLVSTGQDILIVLLENAGCCLPLPRHPPPHRPHVREAEETLAHIQSLGLTSLAAQWLISRARPRTTVRPSTAVKSLPKDKGWSVLQRSSGGGSRLGVSDQQEDSTSQTTSNISNPSNTSNASESDENAPILGRRAERSGISISAIPSVREPSDDSDSDNSESDSDWGSFKGLSLQDGGTGIFDNPYLPSNLGDLDDITPSKITAGPENQLFNFVMVDGKEGVLITPGGETSPPSQLMAKFTEAAHKIHEQLQHNVQFRATADPRGLLNKSLIAVKECGVLLDGEDGGKAHWVVGRLFFMPKPREVYVCYNDDAPQNILELAFRLGLGVAG